MCVVVRSVQVVNYMILVQLVQLASESDALQSLCSLSWTFMNIQQQSICLWWTDGQFQCRTSATSVGRRNWITESRISRWGSIQVDCWTNETDCQSYEPLNAFTCFLLILGVYTVSQERSTFCFFNNPVKHQSILIIFGIENSEEIWLFMKLSSTP